VTNNNTTDKTNNTTDNTNNTDNTTEVLLTLKFLTEDKTRDQTSPDQGPRT